MRNEFIAFLPRTFSFDGASGTGSADDEINHDDLPDSTPEEIVLEQVRVFARSMLGEDGAENEVEVDDDVEISGEDKDENNDTTRHNTVLIPSAELMTKFENMMRSPMEDLLGNVVSASACLEAKDRGSLKGSISSVRKAKSIVGRWLDKSGEGGETSASTLDSIPIERDTLVTANVDVGEGASRVTIKKEYRVVDIHEKYYNKWFMSKKARKVWGKDSKYKLKVRMQEVDAVGKYSDVNLHHETYKKKDVCRIMTDGEITGVLGQLKRGPV